MYLFILYWSAQKALICLFSLCSAIFFYHITPNPVMVLSDWWYWAQLLFRFTLIFSTCYHRLQMSVSVPGVLKTAGQPVAVTQRVMESLAFLSCSLWWGGICHGVHKEPAKWLSRGGMALSKQTPINFSHCKVLSSRAPVCAIWTRPLTPPRWRGIKEAQRRGHSQRQRGREKVPGTWGWMGR